MTVDEESAILRKYVVEGYSGEKSGDASCEVIRKYGFNQTRNSVSNFHGGVDCGACSEFSLLDDDMLDARIKKYIKYGDRGGVEELSKFLEGSKDSVSFNGTDMLDARIKKYIKYGNRGGVEKLSKFLEGSKDSVSFNGNGTNMLFGILSIPIGILVLVLMFKLLKNIFTILKVAVIVYVALVLISLVVIHIRKIRNKHNDKVIDSYEELMEFRRREREKFEKDRHML